MKEVGYESVLHVLYSSVGHFRKVWLPIKIRWKSQDVEEKVVCS